MDILNYIGNIDLLETGIYADLPKGTVSYNCIKENNIKTLKQLVEMYDSNSIDYYRGKKLGKKDILEIQGVIDIVLYKYLGRPLKFDPFINLAYIVKSGYYSKPSNIIKNIMRSIGLPERVSLEPYWIIRDKNYSEYYLIDFLEDLKEMLDKEEITISYYQELIKEKVKCLLKYCYSIKDNRELEEYINNIVNPWYEIMDPQQLAEYRKYKEDEVTEVFSNVDWGKYNEAMLLKDDKDFYAYIELKRKMQ